MRCSQVHKLSSEYLDGELDNGRSSALRGHLRTCTRCADALEDEQAVRRAARDLSSVSDPNLDPSGKLWEQIGDALAAAEIADAETSPTRLWFRNGFRNGVSNVWGVMVGYRAHLAVALVLAIVGGALVVKDQAADQRSASWAGSDTTLVDQPTAEFAGSSDTAKDSQLETAMREIRRSDERYLSAIGELRELAVSERDSWTASAQARFDDAVAEFESQAASLKKSSDAKVELIDGGDVRTRDELYQLYKRHIDFLEGVVFQQMSASDEPATGAGEVLR